MPEKEQITEHDKELKDSLLFTVGILLFSVSVVGYIANRILDETLKTAGDINSLIPTFVASAVIVIIIIAYSIIRRKALFGKPFRLIFALGTFLISSVIVVILDSPVNLPVWAFGAIAVSVLVDLNLGLFYSYFFILQAVSVQSYTLRGIIILLVATSVTILLAQKMKNILSMLYIMVINGCVVLICSLVLNSLHFNDTLSLVTLKIVISYIISIGLSMVLKIIFSKQLSGEVVYQSDIEPVEEDEENNGFAYLEKIAEQLDSEERNEAIINNGADEAEIAETSSENTEKTAVSENIFVSDTETAGEPETAENAESSVVVTMDASKKDAEEDFSAYCDENADLLMQLKAVKKSAYLNALRVAKIATECAENLDVNKSLVTACGLYHEIGKLKPGNVADNLVDIVFENDFPDKLASTLDECVNKSLLGYGSKEAALVSLTSKVLNTYFYLKSTGAAIKPEKITDNAIGKVVVNGKLNDTGLTIKECSFIRDFLVETLKKINSKNGEQ